MKQRCCYLDDDGKRCRRLGTYDHVFGDPTTTGSGSRWFVVYTCGRHRTTEAERHEEP